jgi:NACalpha-BTF3-like transcription factor
LDQAFVLLQCLRMLAPPDAVQQLLDLSPRDDNTTTSSSITASDAIAALRKNQGDVNAAAMALTEAKNNRLQCQQDRELQHRHGVCQNEIDPVNLAAVESLRPLLVHGDEDEDSELAVGLLRLANNDLTRALDLYASCDHSSTAILAKVDELDGHLVEKGLLNRAVWKNKKRKRRKENRPVVDEMALVTLMSMGVDDAKARLALHKNDNHVDRALLWLTATAGEQPGSTLGEASSSHEQQEPDMAEIAPLNGNSGDEQAVNGPGGVSPPPPELISSQQQALERAARELLHRELGDVLEERNLEKEYLGKSLDEEWHLVLKYRGQKMK